MLTYYVPMSTLFHLCFIKLFFLLQSKQIDFCPLEFFSRLGLLKKCVWLGLANCVEFTPEHAAMMAHCFQERCNKLRLIDLSSCNTGHCNVNNYNNDDNNDDCDNIIYYNINKIIIIIITNFYKVIISIIPVY